ncbi:tRNA lysidine(34) synthetase TilS [Mycoplasma sp. 2045]|uniref:tRNA lysidine(34) synthetase TilS n=1 Tax=Mycoplasma sp. 2045 TaxID=2967301 RepID=UPI00211C427E|nr:tRNA lysidine(34) synthetase TilS [Mycoplasma sp. 2045]UUM20411.1 tRNA lysidine(34) synthetase TilS [Mycoplasma sp. 2045]
MSNQKTKYLLAVSGGPDSMFMLDEYKNKNIIVAHVNYNQRADSGLDQKVVEDFCKRHNIMFYVLELSKNDYVKGNFQSWAREQRYKFFKEVYVKENCDKLLISHNKDDFFETAYMQKQSKRNVLFYGIKQSNLINGINIYRPYLFKYFKNTITKKNQKNHTPFCFDYTNNLPKYSRNKIRLDFAKKTLYKNTFIACTLVKNFFLSFKRKKIQKEFQIWKESRFKQDVFEKLKHKKHLVYQYIHTYFSDENIELSSLKIKSIIDFILSKNRTSKYLLKNGLYFVKLKGELLN